MAATTTLPYQTYLSNDFLIDGCLMCDIYSCLRFRDVSGTHVLTFANHICKFLEAISWSLKCIKSFARDAWKIFRNNRGILTSLLYDLMVLCHLLTQRVFKSYTEKFFKIKYLLGKTGVAMLYLFPTKSDHNLKSRFLWKEIWILTVISHYALGRNIIIQKDRSSATLL